MNVKILTNLGSQDYPDCPYLEGECHDVSEVLGLRLVRNKHAVAIAAEETPAPKPAKASAKKNET